MSNANKKHSMHARGFIKVYIFFLCLIFLVIAAAYYVGKKFPSNEIIINDPVASRYEVAGVDLNENPSLYPDRPIDPNADSYEREYLNTYPRNSAPSDANWQLALAQPQAPANNNLQNPVQTAQLPEQESAQPSAQMASSTTLTFVSKENNRISFAYPADMKVREGRSGEAIVFTLTNPESKSLTVTYEKAQSGCFDPLRSFAVDPSSGNDYRILYPQKSFVIEEKYQALRNDEEIGRYIFAGNDPTRPFALTSNVCAQTAVPTRLRITSTQFTAADKAYLMGVHDVILSKITL